MRTRTTSKPLGTDSATDHFQQQSERTNNELQFFPSGTVKTQRTTRGIRLTSKPSGFASPLGLHIQDDKIEVDTDVGYDQWVVINVQSTHTLVVDGVIDRTTGVLVHANAGQYYSRQSVDAIGADGKWNVPQNPIPVPTNLDDDTNFWIPMGGGGGDCPYA